MVTIDGWSSLLIKHCPFIYILFFTFFISDTRKCSFKTIIITLFHHWKKDQHKHHYVHVFQDRSQWVWCVMYIPLFVIMCLLFSYGEFNFFLCLCYEKKKTFKQRWSIIQTISTKQSHLHSLNIKKGSCWKSMSWLGTCTNMWGVKSVNWIPLPLVGLNRLIGPPPHGGVKSVNWTPSPWWG